MRSRLEKILLEQLRQLTGPHLLIRGVPDEEGMVEEHNIVIKPFADRQFLARHLPAAQFIICRSGYSTLMDLAALNLSAKVILIPTPGQTEQELLAQTQVQSGDALAAFAQGEIDLAALIK
jgi:UDP-N-acetylglucosamine:LPS N-acetylglucosamine transferase